MQVREATPPDHAQVLGLVRLHYTSTDFPQEFVMDDERSSQHLWSLMCDHKQGNLFVACEGLHVFGALGVQLIYPFFTRDVAAHDSFFHIEEEFRGRRAGIAMFQMAEAWAKSVGAKSLMISNHPLSPGHVRPLYERYGYREAQTDYIKRL
jgi:GNAT superfamily N-acetyltransferase